MSSTLEEISSSTFFALKEESEGGPKSIYGPFLHASTEFFTHKPNPDSTTWPKVLERQHTVDESIATAIRESKSKPCDVYTIRDLYVRSDHKISEGYGVLDMVKHFTISPGPHVNLGLWDTSFLEEDKALFYASALLPSELHADEIKYSYFEQGATPPGVEPDEKKKYQWDVMFGAITNINESTKDEELKRLVTVTKVRVKGNEREYPSAIVREIVNTTW